MEGFKGVACLGLLLKAILLVECADNLDRTAEMDVCRLSGCEPTSLAPGSYVREFCREHNFNISSRCCLGGNGTIIGLDLSNCNLTTLEVLQQNLVSDSGSWDKSQLAVLSLEGNAVNDSDTEYFTGMNELNYLSLPADCKCPGGPAAWNLTISDEHRTICENQVDICELQDVQCPNNSHCVMNSPGIDWCICNETYYGYKCMQQGSFPVIPVSVGLSVGTVVIAALGHLTLRRNARPVT